MRRAAKGSQRAQLPLWHFCLYLGDQCGWHISGTVAAATEHDAINEGRLVIRNVWPWLWAQVESCPASATYMHPSGGKTK